MTVSLFAALTLGVTSLPEAAGMSLKDILALGVARPDALLVRRLHKVYYGDTKATTLQAEARAAAIRHKYPLRVLEKIENLIASAPNKATLRALLADTAAEDITTVAAKHIKKKPKEEYARLTQSPDGWARLTIFTKDQRLLDFANGLPGVTPKSREKLLDGFKEFVEGETTLAPPRRMVHVVLKLDEMDTITRGEGEDVTIRASDGSVRTGAELLQEKVAPYFQATIINWRGEPIDNYYGREFTKKAIDMNTAVYLECLNPNCPVPRDRCENDHIVAVNKGGLSILDNLMPLCRYHNGKKADGDSYWKDDEGRIWYQPAYGDPVIC